MRDETPVAAVAHQTYDVYNALQRQSGTVSALKQKSQEAAIDNVVTSEPLRTTLPRAESTMVSFASAPMLVPAFNRDVDSTMSVVDAPSVSVGSKRGRDVLEHAVHSQTASQTSDVATEAEASSKRPHAQSLHAYAEPVGNDSAAEAAASNVVIVNEEPDEAEEGASLWNL